MPPPSNSLSLSLWILILYPMDCTVRMFSEANLGYECLGKVMFCIGWLCLITNDLVS